MMRIFAIRPQPALAATIESARAIGLEVEGRPLFEIRPLDWEPPPPGEIDGLLLGSANALRHGGSGLALFKDKPAYAVGEATAEEARRSGFAVAGVGEGRLQPLVASLAGKRRKFLRVTGQDHVAVDPPEGIAIVTRIAYRSVPLPMPEELAGALRSGGLVLLHSAVAAFHFAGECDRLEIGRDGIALAALAPRIAAAAGSGWAEVRSADSPQDAALLALAQDMCH